MVEEIETRLSFDGTQNYLDKIGSIKETGAHVGVANNLGLEQSIDSNVIGTVGAVLLLGAFAANITKRLSADSKIYLLANIIGAAALAYNGFDKGALPGGVLNTVWTVIPSVQFIRNLRKRQ